MPKAEVPPNAGWYPNPDGPGNRFWSGSAWTGSLQDAEGSEPAPAEEAQEQDQTQSQGYKVIQPPSKGAAKWWRRWF